MNIKAKCLVVTFTLSVLSGGAFAGALDVIDPYNRQPSYTSSIKGLSHTDPILRSRFRSALEVLPREKRMSMIRDCQDAGMTKPYAEFCNDLYGLRGSR